MFVIYLISVFYEGLSVASQILNMYRDDKFVVPFAKLKMKLSKFNVQYTHFFQLNLSVA